MLAILAALTGLAAPAYAADGQSDAATPDATTTTQQAAPQSEATQEAPDATTPMLAASVPWPDHLKNGDFGYLGGEIMGTAKKAAGDTYYPTWNFANVDYIRGDAGADKKYAHVPGFDRGAFAWESNQTDVNVDGRAPIVEIQLSRDLRNTYGEITASQPGTYLYQNIYTQHDYPTVYSVRLKHSSRNPGLHHDSMQVLVGPIGHEQPVELVRTAGMDGDKVGEKGTTITSSPGGWDGAWDTYQGSVVVPANQEVTRFTFRSVNGLSNVAGNLIDDVSFDLAYPLTYDGNGGQGTLPQQNK